MDPHIKHFINHCWGSIGKDGTYPPFFPGPQPISIERKHMPSLQKKSYCVCEKTDGTRIALVCATIGGEKISVIVNRAMHITPVKFKSLPKMAYEGTVLDGEMVQSADGKQYLMVYDAVIVSGIDVKRKNLHDRMHAIKKFVSGVMKMKTDPFIIKLKKFYSMEEVGDLISDIKNGEFCYDTDGLVFTPVQDPIRMGTHETMFKWKPKEKNTVDFLVKNRSDGTIGLYIQDRGDLVFGSLIKPDNISSEWKLALVDNTIVECKYMEDSWPRWWNPVNIRTDKTHPNNRRTLNNTMINIEENIQIHEFTLLNKQK